MLEAREMISGSSSVSCLFKNRAFFSAVQKDNKIVFFTGYSIGSHEKNKFDIYDVTNNSWSIGYLTVNTDYQVSAYIISVNNNIYLAGSYENGVLSD